MDEISRKALNARNSETDMNELILEHHDWILQCAGQNVHHFVTDSDEEWSAALMAFSEAVQKYDETKGAFRPFAAVVIRRRLMDHMRSRYRWGREINVIPGAFDGELTEEDADSTNVRVMQQVADESVQAASGEDNASMTREEIDSAQIILQKYGFSFFDLADSSPKTVKTKESCAQAVRALTADPLLLEHMRTKKKLPIRELCRQSGVSRKILDRHRRYIIAAAEILNGDFPILASYMDYIRKEG